MGYAPNSEGFGTDPTTGIEQNIDDQGPEFYDKTGGNAFVPKGDLRADLDRVPDATTERLATPEAGWEQFSSGLRKMAEGLNEIQDAVEAITQSSQGAATTEHAPAADAATDKTYNIPPASPARNELPPDSAAVVAENARLDEDAENRDFYNNVDEAVDNRKLRLG